MGLDSQEMVDVIVGGTTGYLVEFLPIGAFIIGLVLAFGIMEWLVMLFVDIQQYKREVGESSTVDFATWKKNRNGDTI